MRIKRILAFVLLLTLVITALPLSGNVARAAAKYTITVDLTNQIVTVYDNGNTGESGIVRQMICSSGKSGTATPMGTYTLPTRAYSTERTEWYYFSKYNCYAKWATRIVGGILFHSVLYSASKRGPTSASVNALGKPASHGCIRLRVADARWIAQNCPAGTSCRIYKSGRTNADLRKRLLKKSFYRGETSYDSFMGRVNKDTLSRGSRGSYVEKLQQRLTALGFLDDTADGIFGAKTETGVRRFQSAAGVKQTGTVNKALWNAMFDPEAPTGTYVPLSKGMEGPAVARLQHALIRLKLLDGVPTGSYDGATVSAVKKYQRYFTTGSATGKANTALQNGILDFADDIARRFGGEDYRLEVRDIELLRAKVKGASSVTLRAKAKSSAKAVRKLKRRTVVTVLKKGSGWSMVQYGDLTGYIKSKYLKFYNETITGVSYEPANAPTATPEIFIPTEEPEDTATPEPTVTPEPTATPEVFIPTPTPEIFVPTATPEPTESPEPSATPEWDWTFILGPDGERVPVDAPEAIAGQDEADVGEVAMALTGDNTHAPAYALAARKGVRLYALPDEQSAVLAKLDAGDALPVLGVEAGWVTVLYHDGAACMRLEDARLADAQPAVEFGDEPEPDAAPEQDILQVEAEPVVPESDEVLLEP